MKKTGIIFFVSFMFNIIFPGNIYPQKNFEGKIAIKVPGIETSGDLSYYLKGHKTRINVEGKQRNSDLIIDTDKKEMVLLYTQMNKYTIIPFNDSETGIPGSKNSTGFERTGIKKTINGYMCEKWTYKYYGGKITAWMTGNIGRFSFFKNPLKNEYEPVWKTEIENSGYFPMSIVEKTKSYVSVSLLEVKSVKRMDIRDDYFQPPDDFEKMKKPDMNSLRNLMQKKH